MGGGITTSTTAERVGSLQLQDSAYALPVRLVYGTQRVSGNLI